MRLLRSSADEVSDPLDKMEKEAKALKEEALRIVWWMRGMSYDEAMAMSYEERQIVSKIVQENIDASKDSGQAIF